MADDTAEDFAFDLDARTIPAVLERAAARFGEAEGLVEGDRRLSFADLAAAADRAARAFVAHGVEAGDRVAVWAPNMADWAIAALGAFRAGAVV
ncbi:MAG: AMP-binding protein, partial [Acidimicrobiales bacterium]|nr:AMP-binding protein [Acidimicrobiales bacterium]